MSSTTPPPDKVEERLSEAMEKLRERYEAPSPVTLAEAMQFIRYAYMRGYTDQLRGEG